MIRILILVLILSPIHSFSQEISEESFDSLFTEIWADYEIEMRKIGEVFNENPEKKDSLLVETEKIEKETYRKLFESATKHISLPNAINFVYNIRNNIPKIELQKLLDSLPKEQKSTEYATLIQKHIHIEQVGLVPSSFNSSAFCFSKILNKRLINVLPLPLLANIPIFKEFDWISLSKFSRGAIF